MKRGIAYRREVRNKQITRKKRILHFQSCYDPFYPKDGYLDKGKIHCSCWMCQGKTNNKHRKIAYTPLHDWKHNDLQKMDRMKEEEKEYREGKFNEDFC